MGVAVADQISVLIVFATTGALFISSSFTACAGMINGTILAGPSGNSIVSTQHVYHQARFDTPTRGSHVRQKATSDQCTHHR